jgi:hypothetical protein
MYGRADDEWDSLIVNTIPVLERVAANRGLTNYTDVTAIWPTRWGAHRSTSRWNATG